MHIKQWQEREREREVLLPQSAIMTTFESPKGQAIFICGGKYRGKEGWLDISKPKTADFTYVIVDMGAGKEAFTKVKHKNVCASSKVPDTFEEALLQQHPDINDDISRLVEKLAQCRVDTKPSDNGSPPRIIKIIFRRLQEATAAQEGKPIHKQRFRLVVFNRMQEG